MRVRIRICPYWFVDFRDWRTRMKYRRKREQRKVSSRRPL